MLDARCSMPNAQSSLSLAMIVEIKLSPADAAEPELVRAAAIQRASVAVKRVRHWEVHKRSIDARGKNPLIVLQVKLFIDELPKPEPLIRDAYKPLGQKSVVIVGAGPAGYFAALELLEHGIKPIVVDRGKDVQSRRIDLRNIQQDGIVNPHSNYCFGEGGAGTYSDGKLYTRSHKRGDIRKALQIFVEHGAKTDILVDAHPHIGSNKLPRVVKALRETILEFGGEIRFDSYVTDFVLDGGQIMGVRVNDKEELLGDAVILATGHSARDIFYLLHSKGILIEAKPYAVGVRLEHPQPLIDRIQYGSVERDPHLPPSSYKLVCQVEDRGVFSFCMCPGGWIVPASTAPGELVVNGMSLSKRDNEYANSGIVVAVELDDLLPFAKHGVFAGLEFQKSFEQAAFMAGGGVTQQAPAQRMIDFVEGKISANLGGTSYIPGIVSAPMHDIVPPGISRRLRQAFRQFGKTMRGYYTNEAQVIGAESRTSSPIRIPRDPETFMHPQVKGLFPAGEGAGYAGGIISAALDGQNTANRVAEFVHNT
jgi:uncharacterized FAD-dependent dehydrogenase